MKTRANELKKARHREYMRAYREKIGGAWISCAVCGQKVRRVHGGEKYCGDACRLKADKQRRAERSHPRVRPKRGRTWTRSGTESLTPDVMHNVELAHRGLYPGIPRVYYQATEGRPYSPHVVQEHWGRNGGRV